MKLYQMPASPYVRKVLITAIELGLEDQIERIAAKPHPIQRNMDLVALNPLGQIPTLRLNDGEILSDSRVICEYFAAQVSDQTIFPEGPRRWQALTEQSVCDGLLAACLSIRYERSTRSEAQQSADWIGGQLLRIETVLDMLETRWHSPPEGFDIGHISVACALGYLAFRFPEIEIAPRWPALARWGAAVAGRLSVLVTAPTEGQ
ncbi:MAG: glutathione S-transferase family protein [Qingshengfaniella sp.]